MELNLEEEDVGYLNNYEFVLTTLNAQGSGIRVGNNEAKGLQIVPNIENITSEDSNQLIEKFSNIIDAVGKVDTILKKTMGGHIWNISDYMSFETSA